MLHNVLSSIFMWFIYKLISTHIWGVHDQLFPVGVQTHKILWTPSNKGQVLGLVLAICHHLVFPYLFSLISDHSLPLLVPYIPVMLKYLQTPNEGTFAPVLLLPGFPTPALTLLAWWTSHISSFSLGIISVGFSPTAWGKELTMSPGRLHYSYYPTFILLFLPSMLY